MSGDPTGIALRVEVLDGTDIEDAYDDIRELSDRLGGVKALTEIAGVRMLYYGQSEARFEKEYVLARMGGSAEFLAEMGFDRKLAVEGVDSAAG